MSTTFSKTLSAKYNTDYNLILTTSLISLFSIILFKDFHLNTSTDVYRNIFLFTLLLIICVLTYKCIVNLFGSISLTIKDQYLIVEFNNIFFVKKRRIHIKSIIDIQPDSSGKANTYWGFTGVRFYNKRKAMILISRDLPMNLDLGHLNISTTELKAFIK